MAHDPLPTDIANLPQPYTPREVAVMFNVSPVTVWRWCERGLIEYFKTPGGHRRFPVKSTRDALRAAAEGRFDS